MGKNSLLIYVRIFFFLCGKKERAVSLVGGKIKLGEKKSSLGAGVYLCEIMVKARGKREKMR